MTKKNIAIPPKSCSDPNLTAGKEYSIQVWSGTTAFVIVDDSGYNRFCLTKKCAHLAGENWILI